MEEIKPPIETPDELKPHGRNFSLFSIACGLAGVFFLLAVFLTGWIWHYAVSPGSNVRQIVYLPPNSSFRQINKILIDAKVVKDDHRFKLLAVILGVANKLKAGEYSFPRQITPYDVLKVLQQGKTLRRVLTIVEGFNLMQAAEAIARAKSVDVKTVLALTHDHVFIKKIGLNVDSLEGFLFPDTYYIKRGTSIKKMLTTMVQRTGRVFREECRNQSNDGLKVDCDFASTPDLTPNGRKLSPSHGSVVEPLNALQALTLASIVEKETGVGRERPIIAQVFISRLRHKMRLQSDPTVMYGLQKFTTPLSRRDLKTPTPYNTYTLSGLPKGPICNPGRAAIAAVMRPAKTNYFYFVSQNNGSHYFSKNLAEHNRAVRRYRRARSTKLD